jgi:hypothetical protein
MSEIIAPWPDTYAALFGRKLEKEIALAMTEEINHRINGLTSGEIGGALRRISQRNQRSNEQRYPPTGEEIIAEILNGRKQMFVSNFRADACAHCHHGWLSFKFFVDEGGDICINGKKGVALHWADPQPCEKMSCPCKCAMGDALVTSATQEVDGRSRTTKWRANELRDAVWSAKMTYERQHLRDEKQHANTSALAQSLARSLEAK